MLLVPHKPTRLHLISLQPLSPQAHFSVSVSLTFPSGRPCKMTCTLFLLNQNNWDTNKNQAKWNKRQPCRRSCKYSWRLDSRYVDFEAYHKHNMGCSDKTCQPLPSGEITVLNKLSTCTIKIPNIPHSSHHWLGMDPGPKKLHQKSFVSLWQDLSKLSNQGILPKNCRHQVDGHVFFVAWQRPSPMTQRLEREVVSVIIILKVQCRLPASDWVTAHLTSDYGVLGCFFSSDQLPPPRSLLILIPLTQKIPQENQTANISDHPETMCHMMGWVWWVWASLSHLKIREPDRKALLVRQEGVAGNNHRAHWCREGNPNHEGDNQQQVVELSDENSLGIYLIQKPFYIIIIHIYTIK